MAQSCSLLSSSASRTTSTIDLVVQLVNLFMVRITAPGGLLLGHSRLGSHLVEVVVHHAHLLLALHLGSLDRLVLTSQVAQGLVRVRQLLWTRDEPVARKKLGPVRPCGGSCPSVPAEIVPLRERSGSRCTCVLTKIVCCPKMWLLFVLCLFLLFVKHLFPVHPSFRLKDLCLCVCVCTCD